MREETLGDSHKKLANKCIGHRKEGRKGTVAASDTTPVSSFYGDATSIITEP